MPQVLDDAADVLTGEGTRSVWERLADRLNPAYERPRVRPDVEWRAFTTTRGEAYYIAKSPSAGTYVRLAPDEYFVLGRMDGCRQVKDLVLAYLLQYKSFAFERIVHLVAQLREHRFLVEEPRDAWDGLAQHLAQRTWTYRIDQLIKSFRYHEFPLTGLDGPITALYRRGGWLGFTRPAVLLGASLSTLGMALFVRELLVGSRDPLRFGGSYLAGLLAFLAVWMVTISLHELGHALTTKHFGREVPRGGFMLYYGMPAFFTDTTDIWMAPRRARLIVSMAGMATIWGLGGLAMLYVVLQHGSPLAPVAFQFALVAFINNSLQLLPLLELDGYYVLVDWLEMPLLRPRALAFVRGDLWQKLRARERFSREEWIFAIYGVLALIFSGFALWAATYLWSRRFQHVVADAWAQESVAWQVLAVVVVVAFGAPLVFGLVLKLRQLAQQGAQGLGRLRHRGAEARAQARLDARALLGRLRFLGELGFREREAVVSQLRLERFPRATYVVRQGAPNDRFYLIRQGQAEVVQVDGAGWPRDLAVLRRGDYFGELGLLHDRPASASVRALTPLDVYVMERAAFETTIAPRLRDYGVTVQWIEARAELARMPLFRYTAASELDAILERLRAAEYPTGAVIVRQADPHDRFYLIRRGRVQIRIQQPDRSDAVIAELGPGASFGEVALLADRPCPATVRALEPVALWSLDKAGFDALMQGELHLAEAIAKGSEQRATMTRHLVSAGTT